MWRAFFFAIGIILVILGLQCLVVDRFFVHQDGKVAGFVNKALNVIEPLRGDLSPAPANQVGNGQFGNASSNQNVRPQNPFQTGGSPFGPSRFQSPYSQVQYAPNQANAGAYGGQPFQPAGYRTASPSAIKSKKGPRPVATKDWMPWCFLATGTIIILYTKSTQSMYAGE